MPSQPDTDPDSNLSHIKATRFNDQEESDFTTPSSPESTLSTTPHSTTTTTTTTTTPPTTTVAATPTHPALHTPITRSSSHPHLVDRSKEEDELREIVRGLDYDKECWFDRFFLTWLTPMVSLGKSYNVRYDDLPQPPKAVLADSTLPKFQKLWTESIDNHQKKIWGGETFELYKRQTPPSFFTPNRLASHQEFLLQTESIRTKPFTPSFPTEQPPVPNGTPALRWDIEGEQWVLPDEVVSTHPVTRAIRRPEMSIATDMTPKKAMIPFFLAFKWDLISSALAEILFYLFAISQPFLIKNISQFFNAYSKGDTANSDIYMGLTWAVLLGMVTFLAAIITLWKNNAQTDFAIQEGPAMLSALFSKTLKIAPYSISNDPQLSSGGVMNLISSDSLQIYNNIQYINYTWSSPLAIAFVLWLMYKELGNSTFVTFALMLLLVPYQLWMARVQRYYKKKALALTDERLKFTSQLLAGLRVVKMSAWESVLSRKLEEFRLRELAILKLCAGWSWFTEIVTWVYPICVTLFTLWYYIQYDKNQFNTETIFVILAYLSTLRLPIAYLAFAVQATINQYVSSQRIGHYLASEEVPIAASQFQRTIDPYSKHLQHGPSSHHSHTTPTTHPSTPIPGPTLHDNQSNGRRSDDTAIALPSAPNTPNTDDSNDIDSEDTSILCELNNVDFYWSSLDQKPLQTPVLTNVSLTLHRGEVIFSIGNSGSGKTALLNGLIGNLYPQQTKQHNGLKSIPSPTTAAQYIRPISDMVITVEDIETPAGLQVTTTTTTTTTASTHSQLRPTTDYLFSWSNNINLIPESMLKIKSRCGFCQQNPWLMNDTIRNNITLGLPFDPEWFQIVVDASSLRPDLEVLIDADLTIVSDGGVSLSGGQTARVAFARCLYLVDYLDIVLLDDIFAAVDAKVAKNMFYNGVIGILKAKGKGVILSINSRFDFLQNCDRTLVIDTITDQSDALYWSKLHQQLSTSYDQCLAQHKQEEKLRLKQEEEKKGWLAHTMEKYPALSPSYTKHTQNSNPISEQEHQQQGETLNREEDGRESRYDDNNDAANRYTEETDGEFEHIDHDDGNSGYRPPSAIVFNGSFDELRAFDHPLVHSITFSSPTSISLQQSEVFFDPLQSHRDLICPGLTGIGEDNTYANAVGRVDLEKEASQAQRLTQQVDAASGADTNGSTPSQAKLSNKLFLFYFQGSRGLFGLWAAFLSILFISLFAVVIQTYTSYILVDWAQDASQAVPEHSTGHWLRLTFLGALCTFVISLAQIVLFAWLAMDASSSIHRRSIYYIFHSTMSYLDKTPIGTLLNYFTKDTEVLDIQLPNNLIYVIQQMFRIGAIFIMAGIASPLLMIPLIPVFGLIWYLRIGFHNTSIQLKRIESITLQPIFSLFNSVLKGGPTIRSFQLQDLFNARFQELVNRYSRISVVSTLVERRFTAYVNCIVGLYVGILAICVVLLRAHLNPNMAMLALTAALSLTSLQSAIRYWTLSTQSLTSIHRLHELKRVEQEARFASDVCVRNDIAQKQPPEFRTYQLEQEKLHDLTNSLRRRRHRKQIKKTKDGQIIDLDFRIHQQHALSFWPWYGGVEFKNLSLRYGPKSPTVINNLSLRVMPNQTVGIVGSTGAGKSTLFGAMARLLQPHKGSIEIDNVDINKVGIGDLRSRISIIPQSPTLFSGTVRSNLDPLTRFTDSELWYSLRLVSMEDKIRMLDGGLYHLVQEMGGNFASSERQLLCIARALLSQPGLYSDPHIVLPTSPSSTPHSNTTPKDSDDDMNSNTPLGQAAVGDTYWGASDLQALETSSPHNSAAQYSSISFSAKSTEGINNNSDNNNDQTPLTPATINESDLEHDDGHNRVTTTVTDDGHIAISTSQSQLTPDVPHQASILLCDEITSSADPQADLIIQNTIRTAFSRATLFVIAHRLDSVIDLDRILVLKPLTIDDVANGVSSLLEFDVPFLLLNNPNSAFYAMCAELGQDNFMTLYNRARDAFVVTQHKELVKYQRTIDYPKEIILKGDFDSNFAQVFLPGIAKEEEGGNQDGTPQQ